MERSVTSGPAPARHVDLLILIIAMGLIVFVAYKAALSSLTHDESLTTTLFFPQGEGDIISYHHPWVAKSIITNNHIFNTLLMKLSESLFGMSEWSLRLPNVLALVVFLWFGYRLLRTLRPDWIRLPAFVLLIANPYLLDFFGVARGYGLSVGAMIFSLYYLITYLKSLRIRHIVLFHLGGILAVMSNFSLLNYYVAAVACLYLLILLPASWQRLRHHWPLHLSNLSGLLILAGLLYTPFRIIIQHKTVDYGGKEGFLTDTIVSLVRRYLYELPADTAMVWMIAYLIPLPILVAVGLGVYRFWQNRADFFSRHIGLVLTTAILVSIAVMTWLQHWWLGQDYLIERFGLFLYPIYSLQLIFLLHWLSQQAKARVVASSLLALLASVGLWITLYNLNTTYYLNWKYDKDTKTAMQILQQHRPADALPNSIQVGIMHKLEPTMNLYRRWWQMDWIAPLTREDAQTTDDFFYIREENVSELGLSTSPRRLFYSQENGLILLKNERE